jgi:hypothetical protein
LQNPFEFYGFKRKFSKHFHLTENLKCRSRKGPRNNGTLEGIAFDSNSNDILAY